MRPAAIALVLAAGCGARTGLREPDVAAPSLDATDARDAAPDTHVRDVPNAPDGAPPCSTDADCDDRVDCTLDACTPTGCTHLTMNDRCDDHRFCNGVETCSLTGCVAGTPPCDDGVDCTDDTCTEPTHCTHTPDAHRCPLSNYCDPTLGCRPALLALDGMNIYYVALPSGAVIPLTRARGLSDIALGADGTLYGAAVGSLVRIDDRTGTMTPLVTVPGNFFALEADPDTGVLYGGADIRILRFDLAARTSTIISLLPVGNVVSGDVAFLGGRLLVTTSTNVGVATDDLFAFTLGTSGPPVHVGNTGFRCVYGLAVYRGTLYGLTCHGEVLLIDPTNASSHVVSTTRIVFDGAAAR